MCRSILRAVACLIIFVIIIGACVILFSPAFKERFSAAQFADNYPYKWANSDQPEVINYGSKSNKNKIKLAYSDGFFKILALSVKDAVPASFKGVFNDRRFLKEITFNDKAVSVGVSFDRRQSIAETVKYLKDAGVKSAIVRVPDRYSKIYNGINHDNIKKGIGMLLKNNIEVVISIPQSRDTVKEPHKWLEHVKDVIKTYYPSCKYFIIGHVPNRVKWGVWDYHEFLRLYFQAEAEFRKLKDVKIIGPSVIDFEWFWFSGLLNYIKPDDVDVLNLLLYVDRRGAPENTQFGFDLSGKLWAMNSIYEYWRDGSTKPVWITEVNWPLDGHGDWAPAGGGIDEDTYANYLIRYNIIALSTGIPERIYWWQLFARGYGLIDDSGEKLRPMPGWTAFKFLKKNIDNATFITADIKEETLEFMFKKNGKYFRIAWSEKQTDYQIDPNANLFDKFGNEIKHTGSLRLTGSPVYVFDK